MKNADLQYLNGFLQAMALVNVGTNHGCWYLIEPVERLETFEKSLDSHFASFFEWLSKRYPHSQQKLQVELLPEWKTPVTQVVHHWFFESDCSPSLHEDYQPKVLTEDFVERLEQALVGPVTAWTIDGGWVANEGADLLLEDAEGYYLLRFSHDD